MSFKPNNSEENKRLLELFKNEKFELWKNYDRSAEGMHESSNQTKKFTEVIGLENAISGVKLLNDERDHWDRNNMHFEFRGTNLARTISFYVNEEGDIKTSGDLEKVLQEK